MYGLRPDTQLHHPAHRPLVLRVASIERAIAFYCNVLGCKVARRRDDLGLIHLSAGTPMIDLSATRFAIESVASSARIHWAAARFDASFAAGLAKNSGFWICRPPQCGHRVRLGDHANQPLAAADDRNVVVPGAGKQGEQEAAYL